MKYLSLFSGVEAATLAWEGLGWSAVAFCENEAFASAVLAERWPAVPNLGDINNIKEKDIKALGGLDLIVFGSPCQDLSIAGKRGGLNGLRSGLFQQAIKIIRWARKHCGLRFALWENVPGAFSSNEGQDFCQVLSQLSGSQQPMPEKWGGAGCCFGKTGLVEWATFDAQYFGVPQRRRRVFVFADFGNWEDRQPLFSDTESLRGDFEAGCEVKKEESSVTEPSADESSHHRLNVSVFDLTGFGQYGAGITASTVLARDYKGPTDLIVYHHLDNGIRSLLPVERERLQGMPDNYTRIPWRGEPAECCPDKPRIQAIGNSMAVPVMRWIGQQISTINLGSHCDCIK